MVPNKHTSGVHLSSSQGEIAWLDKVKPKMSSQGMNWNILHASFTPASSYSQYFIIPNEMTTVRFMPEKIVFEFQHTFSFNT